MIKIGVFGSAAGKKVETLISVAGTIGVEIARQDCILVTGACMGLPHEAALGAAGSGGLVIGISPAMNLTEHLEYYRFPQDPYLLIFTGMEKKGRNVISTRTCDGAIFMAGRIGTLNEFTNFYDEADEYRVIGLLAGSGGCVDNYIIPMISETEKRSKARIIVLEDPIDLVHKMVVRLRTS